MPEPTEANRYDHLPLEREPEPHDRRTRPAPIRSAPPTASERNGFATKTRQAIDTIEQNVATRPAPPTGIQPHLVFRVPLKGKESLSMVSEALTKLGLNVVSIEPDAAIIAFRDNPSLSEFREAVEKFEAGPRPGINETTGEPFKGTGWDILFEIKTDEMRSLTPADRIGKHLSEIIGDNGERADIGGDYKLDVELWHRGTRQSGYDALEEVAKLFQYSGDARNRILDSYVGDVLCKARIAVTGRALIELLKLDIVAEVDRPRPPQLMVSSVESTTARDFPIPPRPPANGPRLCVIDSGITSAHPLLSNNVGHEQAVLLNTASAADQHGHGTMVGALAVFGDVRAAYLSGRFASEVTLFSARVLNDRNEFDDEQLRITQIRKAIEAFIADPYKCRVFNISIGTVDSAFKNGSERQTEWAEELDILAREYKVLIVVSAGNNPVARAGMPGQAEEAFNRYPQQLFTAENRINDPGSAAIAVTVGAISEHDQPGRNPGNVGDDIRQAVAGINGPSPFTRVGPGIAGAIKPEFVEYGGNYAFRGRGIVRQVAEDDNTSIMSFHRVPSEKLFTFDNGNSYSAATVSHAAAKILKRLEDTPALNGATPDPNLVRAVMGICAFVPSEAAAQLAQCEEDAVLRSYGYGRINLDLALRSKDRFAVMVAQERIELDKFMLFRIPITDDFTSAPGAKYIRVALAFDPPVRRRRQNYLGVEMSFDVIRGMTPDQIVEAYRALESDEDADVVGRAPSGSNRVAITPSTQSRTGSKLSRNRSTLQVGEAKFSRMNDYGNTYYVVVRCQRKWAPDTVALQDFGIAVALTAENDRLFTSLRARVRMPVRTRVQS